MAIYVQLVRFIDDAMEKLGNETILVVDDDSAVLRLAAAMLQRHGYSVLEANGGTQGLECFAQHHKEISLILSDIDMPQMTGTEMIRQIRNLHPSVPVMVMTGCSADAPLPQAVPVLPKPFTSKMLLQGVRECLAQAQLNLNPAASGMPPYPP